MLRAGRACRWERRRPACIPPPVSDTRNPYPTGRNGYATAPSRRRPAPTWLPGSSGRSRSRTGRRSARRGRRASGNGRASPRRRSWRRRRDGGRRRGRAPWPVPAALRDPSSGASFVPAARPECRSQHDAASFCRTESHSRYETRSFRRSDSRSFEFGAQLATRERRLRPPGRDGRPGNDAPNSQEHNFRPQNRAPVALDAMASVRIALQTNPAPASARKTAVGYGRRQAALAPISELLTAGQKKL